MSLVTTQIASLPTPTIIEQVRVTRKSPVDDKTTEITAHAVLVNGEEATEVIVEEAVYNNFKKRFSPRKLLVFTLLPEQKRQLVDLLQRN